MKGYSFFTVYVTVLTVILVTLLTIPLVKTALRPEGPTVSGTQTGTTSFLDILTGKKSAAESADIAEASKNPAAIEAKPDETANQQAKDAWQLYNWNLPLMITTYSIYTSNRPYFAANTEEWNKFIAYYTKDPIIDPFTSKAPVFTTDTPKTGEVQYITPGQCSLDKPEFVPTTVAKSYAFRALTPELLCYSNTTGSIYASLRK